MKVGEEFHTLDSCLSAWVHYDEVATSHTAMSSEHLLIQLIC